ncbi:MAG: hypothetical protein K1000chlam4_00007 [Chlamydiae bacterium]|nr:hypothetical protein [Chlamydiota bacterium]
MAQNPNYVLLQKKQSALPLTAIQVAGATSLPVLNSSIQLAHDFGFFKAFWILLAGSILVWLVALTIITMTANTTKSTLDNTKDYLGRLGAYIVALTLITSTIGWFVLQTNVATKIILTLVPIVNSTHINSFLQIGVGLGILSTISCMEGMRGLRWVALISFPILLTAFGLFLFFIPTTATPISMLSPSSTGLLAFAFGTSLSISVDYPTFFRHSVSKRQSLIAVSAIQLITFLMGVGGLYLGDYIELTSHIQGWHVIFTGQLFMQILFLILVVLSCLCVNMVNVYSASIGWEMVVPIFAGRKEYTILGLGLTSAFVLTTNIIPMHFLMKITEVILSNLCLVLVFAYFGKKLLNRPVVPRLDQALYLIGWILGSAIALTAALQTEVNTRLFLLGYLLSVLSVVLTFSARRLFTRPFSQRPG